MRSAETEREERHATWFELFFDLVFVLAVGQLSGLLQADTSLGGFARFIALFVPVWWAWVVYVTYADRFDTDDPAYRVIVIGGMLAILAMAVNLPRAFTDTQAAPFAISYVLVRLVPLLLYLRAAVWVPLGRELASAYALATLPAAALWLGGLLLPQPLRSVAWLLAASIEVLNPLLRARGVVSRTPVAVTHLAERFGLFTIIVLGEAVLSVGTTLGVGTWQLEPALLGAATFIVIAAQWWLYFDFMDGQPLRRGFRSRQVFVYGHLPIVVGITALAAGTKLAIGEVAAGASMLNSGALWAIFGGAVVFELSTALIHAARHSARDILVWERAAAAVALVLIGALAGAQSPWLLLGAIVLVHLGQVIFELSWHGPEV